MTHAIVTGDMHTGGHSDNDTVSQRVTMAGTKDMSSNDSHRQLG